jgi:outer membrane murein-binding lipoprotein Lpp
MEKERTMVKNGISLVVIFGFLLAGCGQLQKVDKMKAEMEARNKAK